MATEARPTEKKVNCGEYCESKAPMAIVIIVLVVVVAISATTPQLRSFRRCLRVRARP